MMAGVDAVEGVGMLEDVVYVEDAECTETLCQKMMFLAHT